MRIFSLKIILVIIIILATGCNDSGTDDTQTKITVMLDLQGSQSTLGQQAMNGFLLGLQQINSEASSHLFVSIIDTKSDETVTQQAAKEIASKISIGAGFTDNNSVLVAGSFFEKEQVPFLSIGATDPTLPKYFDNTIFLVPFGDNAQAAAAAEFAVKEFGKTAAVLWDSTSEYTKSLLRYFQTRFNEVGGSVVLSKSYPGGCDISSFTEEILKSSPSFIYLAGLPDCIGEVIMSLRNAGVNLPIIGGDGLDTPNLVEKNPDRVNDVWLTTHAWLSQEKASPATLRFLDAYKNAYQSVPKDAFAALGYDAANLLVDVLKRAGSSNSAKIFNALENTKNFEGVTGTISYTEKNHVPQKTVWIIKVNKGKRSLADHFVPENIPF